MTTDGFVPAGTEIGFVGLGIMGEPMARNLLRAGYSLKVHNRSRPALDRLVSEGATAAHSPAEVADGADVAITMLPDSPDVEAVVTGDDGIAASLTGGSVLIDMSTISPVMTRRLAASLAARDITMLDAPVSGGQQGAIDGALSIMVGGDKFVFEACRPIFEHLGKSITLVGESGAGQVTKACNQAIVAGTIQIVAEALTLASRSGVDPATVREALLGGFASSKILEVHGKRILDRQFDPGFKVRLHEKDLKIALETAADARVPLFTTALLKQLLTCLVAQGHGERDHSALALLTEELAGAAA
ncbi:MAG: 2-hydroxy-3-oxopropionate reductase [Nitriliruptorales bacterium]|nr:2-hydroxy-3-oxopropionate reductase [Nitriliruptorales bacterium]